MKLNGIKGSLKSPAGDLSDLVCCLDSSSLIESAVMLRILIDLSKFSNESLDHLSVKIPAIFIVPHTKTGPFHFL
jgi:hypothetical protein